MTGVTAIIQVHYPERAAYWWPILTSLTRQTEIPERVILWANGASGIELELEPLERACREDLPVPVDFVRFSANSLMGRWSAVLLAETPFVYIQDDDLVMGPETVEQLLEASGKHFGALVGPFGMNFGPDPEKPYTSGRACPSGPCDVILGRCFLASRSNLLRRLSLLSDKVPFGRNDDIFVSTAVGTVNYAVPGIASTNLDEQGVGLSHEEGHMDERNAAARAVLAGVR